MYELGNGQEVSCLTDHKDGTISLRLLGEVVPGPDGPVRTVREIRLLEPTAIEYAELRTMIIDADRITTEKFPPPPAPAPPPPFDEMDEAERRVAVQRYSAEVAEYARIGSERVVERENFIRSPETALYAQVVLRAAKMLGGQDIALAELPVDAMTSTACTGLLEIWETPLGGRGDRQTPNPSGPAAPEMPPVQPASTEPASSDLAPSSPPGTEPSSPSPLPPSTDSA